MLYILCSSQSSKWCSSERPNGLPSIRLKIHNQSENLKWEPWMVLMEMKFGINYSLYLIKCAVHLWEYPPGSFIDDLFISSKCEKVAVVFSFFFPHLPIHCVSVCFFLSHKVLIDSHLIYWYFHCNIAHCIVIVYFTLQPIQTLLIMTLICFVLFKKDHAYIHKLIANVQHSNENQNRFKNAIYLFIYNMILVFSFFTISKHCAICYLESIQIFLQCSHRNSELLIRISIASSFCLY